MKNIKKRIIVLLMVMAIAFSFTSMAGAVNEEYMGLVPTDGIYAQYLEAGDIGYIELIPYGSTFSTAADAESVEYDVIGDDFVLYLDTPYAESFGNGYSSVLYFYVDDTAEQGAVSIQAEYGDMIGNITISVNDSCDLYVSNITVQYKIQNNTVSSYSGLTVYSTGYYGNTDYPSALDSIYACEITSPTSGSSVTDYALVPYYVPFDIFIVGRIEVGGIEYDNVNLISGGSNVWTFEVIRNNTVYTASQIIAADDFRLENYDTIVWNYGYSPYSTPHPMESE